MILTSNIKIKTTNKNIHFFKEKYSCISGDVIDVDINDLPKGSRVEIDVECDTCHDKKKIKFKVYNRITNNNTEKYFCKKCKCIKTTNTLSNIGFSNVMNIPEVKEKHKKSIKDAWYNNHDTMLSKIRQTNNTKYGENSYTQTQEYKEIMNDINDNKKIELIKKYKNEYNLDIIEFDTKSRKCKIKGSCGHIFDINFVTFHSRKFTTSNICTICNPLNDRSGSELEIINFIKNNYDGEIIHCDNETIKPKHIDIFLPDIKLAIEFNGLYWHNELYREDKYHQNKTELCEKNNINLFHVWEDDWKFKKDIIKSMLLNKINKTPNKIFARKCEIKEIDNNQIVKKFLDENHLQGFVGSNIKLGLYYENELVSLMTFGKKRKIMNTKHTQNEFELIRFCNKLNTNVIGGASKLFSYFIKKYEPNEILTFADRSHSNGNLYYNLGFKLVNKTAPNYYYVLNEKRYHRFGFRKDVLVKQGYDINKSEHDIMLEREIYRIYDAGNYKFFYKTN